MTVDRKPEQAEPEPLVAQTPQNDASPKPARKKSELESASPFSITVGLVYEGPLDLLLDLIRKQDIDIYDIPIAKITAQFLSYVENLKQTDVDAAGEFIYTAALLIHIKSRMLLPRSPAEAGEAAAHAAFATRVDIAVEMKQGRAGRPCRLYPRRRASMKKEAGISPGLRLRVATRGFAHMV